MAKLFLDYEPGIHYPQFQMQAGVTGINAVSYTHLRAHETSQNLVCRLLLEKNFFFNDTATTEIYTATFVGSVRCV